MDTMAIPIIEIWLLLAMQCRCRETPALQSNPENEERHYQCVVSVRNRFPALGHKKLPEMIHVVTKLSINGRGS